MGQAHVTLRFEALLDSGAEVQLRPALEAFSVDVVGDNWTGGTQVAKTIEDPLMLGNVAPGGLLALTNRGAAGTWIDVRAESGGPNLMRLLPGETNLWRTTPGAQPYVVASVDTVDLEVLALEA
jgi:hypothetical protein